jgi:hypothetical protein
VNDKLCNTRSNINEEHIEGTIWGEATCGFKKKIQMQQGYSIGSNKLLFISKATEA